jgi:hypothetical protein
MNELLFPEVRAGEAVACGGLAVFPLYPERSLFPEDTVDYLLSDEAQRAGTCTVREMSKIGVVGQVVVQNIGDHPVLFVEGDILIGAKQNRAVRSSVLVGAGSRIVMPVCCVERKRWTLSSPSLTTGSHSPPSLRYLLKRGGDGTSRGRFIPQEAIWEEVRRKHQATATRSERENLCDPLDAHRDRVEDLRRTLPYPEGASGITITVNGKVVCLDVFDKPATLEKLWPRLVQGLALDALEYGDKCCQASGTDISVAVYKKMSWRRVETVGLGETYWATGEDESLTTALVMDGTLVHLSVSIPIGG